MNAITAEEARLITELRDDIVAFASIIYDGIRESAMDGSRRYIRIVPISLKRQVSLLSKQLKKDGYEVTITEAAVPDYFKLYIYW